MNWKTNIILINKYKYTTIFNLKFNKTPRPDKKKVLYYTHQNKK